VILLPQDVPVVAPQPSLLQQLQTLGWVDHTALAVLGVFFVLGLFKGLIWQVSRIAILVAAYVVAGRFGSALAELLTPHSAAAAGTNVAAPSGGSPAVPGSIADLTNGVAAVPPAPDAPSDTTLYLAYVLLFVAVLIVLSLLAIVLRKLAAKAGLSFFDRLGGGVLGVATGACVVLFGLFVVHMFFQGSQLAIAAHGSHSLRLSKRAIDWLGDKVPDALREVLALAPLHAGPPGTSALAPLPWSPDQLPGDPGPNVDPLQPQPRPQELPGAAPPDRARPRR
jgi:uncharacterized membrane protein required for colicin V production